MSEKDCGKGGRVEDVAIRGGRFSVRAVTFSGGELGPWRALFKEQE